MIHSENRLPEVEGMAPLQEIDARSNSTLYAEDVYAWAQTTAALVQAGVWGAIDREALAEELQDLGSSQYDTVSSAVYQILVHLLKWRYQGVRRSRSWRRSLVEHRNRIPRKLRRAPSLASQIPIMIGEEYPDARYEASVQTGLPLATFPDTCPWTASQVLDRDFLPDAQP
jgi:hypothetical protein